MRAALQATQLGPCFLGHGFAPGAKILRDLGGGLIKTGIDRQPRILVAHRLQDDPSHIGGNAGV